MLPSAIVAEINNYGFDSVNYPDARVYALLTRANRRVCAIAPFPFTQKFFTWTETSVVPTNVGAPLTGAPTDIRAVQALGMPAIADNAGNVAYLDRNLISKVYGYNSYLLVDFPRHYNVWGRNTSGGMNLYVYPYISTNTIFALDYYQIPPVLSAGTTAGQMLLPDEYCDVIQWLVLAELSKSDGDLEDAAAYYRDAQNTIAALINDFDANMDSPPPMIFTDTEDSWFG
jgi:hypothetical protein